MKNILFFIFLFWISYSLDLQSQVEVLVLDESVDQDQYAFIFDGRESSLINRCGDKLASWEHETITGLTSSLTPDSQLLRSGKISGCCFQSSRGGLIELIDFDGNVNWSYPFANDSLQQHHDLHYMPNGNIMFLVWETVNLDERIELGKEILGSELWTESIYEIKPIGEDDFEMVWEWHLADHLIQDIDSTKSNYARIDTSLNKVDVNYMGPLQFSVRDWWHVNALDYNEERDEILINSRANGELWIIDHSTTSEEARGDTGGNRNKGGGLLFRWGNPEAHGQGNSDDLRMFGSHGHNWIKEGLPNAGKILFFNNGIERPSEDFFSTIELLDPMIDNESNYVIENSQFAINSTEVVYGNADTELFGSSFQSNAQQLNSGGFLINSHGENRLFEINNENEIIWEIKTNLGFESFLYPADFTGFDNFIPEKEYNVYFISSSSGDLCRSGSVEILSLIHI